MFIHSVYINLSNKIGVSNLDIQYIDKDEALEDLSVVERELNDDYQPKSVRINEAGKKSLRNSWILSSLKIPPQLEQVSSCGGRCHLNKLAISSLQCRYWQHMSLGGNLWLHSFSQYSPKFQNGWWCWGYNFRWRKYFWKLSRLSEIIQVDVLESHPLSLHTKVETCRSC